MTKPIYALNTGIFNALKLYPESWSSTTAYSAGDLIKPNTYNTKTYLVTTAGTTASIEPSWSSTEGATVSSGTCVFKTYDSKTYNVKAPQTASVPYICFGLNSDITIGDFSDLEAVESSTFWVNVFSDKSVSDVSELTDEVLNTLDNATLSVTGYTPLVCKREYIGNILWDNETGIFQVPLRYRVLISL
jgi:hypothetical protein